MTEQDPDAQPIMTPWGEMLHSFKVVDGVYYVDVVTEAHEGLLVHEKVATSVLSLQALDLAQRFNEWFAFEHDSDICLAFYEHPEWYQKLCEDYGIRFEFNYWHERNKRRKQVLITHPEYIERKLATLKTHDQVATFTAHTGEPYQVWAIVRTTKDKFTLANGNSYSRQTGRSTLNFADDYIEPMILRFRNFIQHKLYVSQLKMVDWQMLDLADLEAIHEVTSHALYRKMRESQEKK